MKHKELSRWLKVLVVSACVVVAVLAFVIVPSVAEKIAKSSAKYAHLEWPFVIFIWVSTIPVIIITIISWKMFTRIGNDNSFCVENSICLKHISRLSLLEVIYYFTGTMILLFIDLLHTSLIITSAVIIFIAFALAVLSAALSHLVMKAWLLKNENDLTV